MPIYNAEKFLKQSLESVLNQTLKEIEIVCVNDGSTDGSLGIIEMYAQKDKRIKIIDKQNTGYGDSMNVGVQNAIGEYIGIVEPDDYVELKMFEELYAYAKNKNADIVKSNHYEFDENGKKTIHIAPNKHMYEKKLNRKNKDVFFATMNTWTGIYRKEFLTENNIWHNTSPGASFQDNGFWFQTMALANSIYFINREFYYHRTDNPNSSINSKSKVFAMCEEYDFIKNNLMHRNLFELFKDMFYVKLFHNYIYTYFRIDKKFKTDFLQGFKADFLGVDLIMLKPFITKKQIKTIKQITTDAECFNQKYKDKTLDYYNKKNTKESITEKIIRKLKRRKINGKQAKNFNHNADV